MSEPDIPQATVRFRSLDGFRGIAAVMVMAHHFEPFFFGGNRFGEGFLAVDLFYLLSGFVLGEAYSRRFEAGLSAWGFMKIRFIRLYPLYILAMAMSVSELLASRFFFGENAGVLKSTLDVWGGLALNLFFLPSPFFRFANPFPWSLPIWSLSYEIVANALWARFWAWLKGPKLAAILLVSGILLVVLGLRIGLDKGYYWGWDHFDVGLCRLFYSFGLGLMFSKIDRSGLPKINANYLFLLIFLVLALDPPASLKPFYDLAAVLAVFPLCVLLATANEPVRGIESELCAFLGDASYGIYLFHFPVLILFILLNRVLGFQKTALLGLVLMLVVVLFAAFLNRFVDGPIRRRLRSGLGPKLP